MQSSKVARSLSVTATGGTEVTVACAVTGYFISNQAATDIFVKVYDKATAATASDTPVMTLNMPTVSGANAGFTSPIVFTNGISLRAVTGVADNDTTGAGANEVIANIFYNEIG